MSHAADLTIAFRIPGAWTDPGDLLDRLPEGCRMTDEGLRLPDGAEFEVVPMPPDDEFFGIFESSCRRPPDDDERAILSRYTVNLGVRGPGGSPESALAMMRAGAALVQAGGAGVFIDNSMLAHGGSDWVAMAEDTGPDAIGYAYAGIIRGKRTVYTTGMHTLGFADLLMNAADVDDDGETIVELIRYICGGEKPVDVGHIFADEQGPRFQIVAVDDDEFDSSSPVHNPFGRLRIVSMRDIAEGN